MADHPNLNHSNMPKPDCCPGAGNKMSTKGDVRSQVRTFDDDDLDRDAELDEYTALTGFGADSLQRNSVMPESGAVEQPPKCSSRSPSRMIMGAITGVFGAPRSPSSLSVLSGVDGVSKRHTNDEAQILIEPSNSASGPEDSASTTSSALDSFTICSASSSSSGTVPNNTGVTATAAVSAYHPSRISRFIVTTTNACAERSVGTVPGSTVPSSVSSAGVYQHQRTANSASVNDTKAPSRQSNQNRGGGGGSSGGGAGAVNETRRVHHLSRPSRIASCMSVQSMDSVASSNSSLSDYPPGTPICKFCHQRARANDPLISPCHCKGTIRYMHCRCLMKWLEKLKKRNSRHQPLACEICNYQYRWKKKFKPTREWQIPPFLGNDRQWHTVFVICALLMLISMVNLVVFSDDPVTGYGGSPRHRGVILPTNHQYQYPAVRFPASHIVQKVSRNGASAGKNQKPPVPPAASSSSSSSSSSSTATSSSSSSMPGQSNPVAGSVPASTLIEPPNSNHTDPNQQPETEAQQQLNNVTLLLGNLSAAFPSLRNLIQQTVRQPSNHSGHGTDGKVTMETVSETIDSFFQQQRLKLAASRTGDSSSPAGSDAANHYLYHSNRNRALRKNTPTRPSEIILVVSGCLFFITFFLGTFAQIKSEISFYTVVLRFIHWNQQWIIEEYDPDGGAGNAGTDAGCESDTESIKDFVTPSHSSTAQSVVDVQPTMPGTGNGDRLSPTSVPFTDDPLDHYHCSVIESQPSSGVCSSPKNSSVSVQIESTVHSQPSQLCAAPSTTVIVTTSQANHQPEVINL